jgi:hypothetical protein
MVTQQRTQCGGGLCVDRFSLFFVLDQNQIEGVRVVLPRKLAHDPPLEALDEIFGGQSATLGLWDRMALTDRTVEG